MQLAAAFVVHHTRPLGQPIVDTREHSKQGTGHQNIVEVGHHVISVLQLNVDRRHGQNQSRKAAHGEHKDEANGKQHGCFKGHGAAPHGGNPVENFHGSRHRNQHGGVHEEQLACHWHAGGKHVVSPHNERQNGNGGSCVHHGGITEQLFA